MAPVLAALTGTAAIVVAAGIAVAGSALPAPTAARTADPSSVALPAGQSVQDCPGPARLLAGADAGTDPQFSPASKSSATAVSSLLLSNPAGVLPGAVLSSVDKGTPLATIAPAPAAGTASAAPSPGTVRKAAVPAAQPVDAASVLRSAPVDGQRSAVNSMLTFTADDGDLRGLAAVDCQTPANDLWLMGASTSVGRTGILLISNTSTTAATVNLELYGDSGAIQAPGASGLLVPPGTVRSVVLAGLAADQKNVAVHLKSTGGPVGAVIQESVLRGLVPGGVEYIAPTNAPAVRQVIAGVQAQEPTLAASLTGQQGYADAATALDVAVPGPQDAVVQVKVYGTGGQASLPNGGVFTAKAGSVSELALTGLPAGSYTIDVRSEASLAASVRVVRGTKAGEPTDLATAVAAPQLGDGQLLVFPSNASSTLLLGVPDGHAKVGLTPVGTDGTVLAGKTVDVGAGTTVSVDPRQLAGTAVAGFIVSATGDPVYGAQLLTVKDGPGIAVAAVPRGLAAAQSVTVLLGY
jgi:hypothetical protein